MADQSFDAEAYGDATAAPMPDGGAAKIGRAAAAALERDGVTCAALSAQA